MILFYFIISILVTVSKSAQRRPLRGETSNLAIRLLDTMQDFESRRGLPQPCSAEAAEVAIGPVEFTALFFRSRSCDGKHACASQFHPSLGTRRACTFRGQTPARRLAATFPLLPPGEECTSPLEPHLFFALRIHWHYHCCRFSWDFSSPFDVFPFQFAPTTITRTRGLPVEHVRCGSLHFGLSLGLFFAIISLNFEEKEIIL